MSKNRNNHAKSAAPGRIADTYSLSESEKSRIKAEEIYRDEVRASLKKPSTPWEKLNLVIGTPLCIWFLSTIVVGLATYFYSQWNAKQNADAQSIALSLRIKQELITRLTNAVHSNLSPDELLPFDDAHESTLVHLSAKELLPFNTHSIPHIRDALLGFVNNHVSGVYDEFRSTDSQMLASRLRIISGRTVEADDVRVDDRVRTLMAIGEKLGTVNHQDEPFVCAAALQELRALYFQLFNMRSRYDATRDDAESDKELLEIKKALQRN